MTHEHRIAISPGAIARRSARPSIAIGAILRRWIIRWRQRRELIDYMAYEHRASSDLAISESDAKTWARKPFWRE